MNFRREGGQKGSPPPAAPGFHPSQGAHTHASDKETGGPAISAFPIFDRHGEVARVIHPWMGRAGTASKHRGFCEMIGVDPKMEALFRMIRIIAESDATILILGESGTGKELVARAIHRYSPRHSRPFVAIDCGAFSETLLESELFGHVRGSFTGAIQNKRGLFQEAHGGTLFLDEIGDSSPVFQSKLLRVLQEGLVRPVGGTRNVSIDVRVIAATNKPLYEAVRTKAFREDLYYRLSVIPIVIPSLRERREDIRPLAAHFVAKYTAKNHKKRSRLSEEALDRLRSYSWPGNVRELENVIERAVVISKSAIIQPKHLLLGEPMKVVSGTVQPSGPQSMDQCLASVERRQIIDALRRHGGNRSRSARELGISRTGLYYIMKRYQITPPY